MNQNHYRTARKFMRETPSTNFNPESLSKQSSLTFYNTMLQQKRKTDSKRYSIKETNQGQPISNHNKTIDFSDFRTHRKTLSVGKQNQFHPLPEIKIPKNKRGAKKGSFLEIWLNEALDEGNGQSNQSHTASLNDQTLGALKSYGLDKKMLKSKNISEETIDKIYKKLYIYTKGLGMTFEEIGKLASAKFSQDDYSSSNEGNAITQIFWRAFTKLLQNESPYETAFQTVEKGYVRTINEMREKIRGIGEEVQRMTRQQELERRKKQRQMQQLMSRYKHLQNDYNVNKATLQLTEKTLDEQVLLRLKFQQKINSVYCSYEQIKTKYNSLIEQIKLKKELSTEMEQHQKSLKEQLQNMTVACHQLQHMLGLQKARNRDFQSEIVLKNEERSELEKVILQQQQQKDQETDQISQQLQRNKLLYSLLNEANAEKDRLKHLYEEQKSVNEKFQARINELTLLNNTLFEEKYAIHNEAEEIKSINSKLSISLSNQTQKVKQLTQQITLLKEQVSSLSNQLSHQKTLKSQASQQLQIKSSLLVKANQTLQKLKEIKDRHQRLQEIAQIDKKLAIQQKLSAMSKVQQQQHQLQALSNQIQQSKQESDIMVNKLSKGNQLAKKKIFQLQEQLNKKEKAILTHLNTIQLQRITIMNKEKQIQQLKQKLQSKDSNIYQLQTSKVYLETNQPIIEQKLQHKQSQLKLQAERYIQNLAQSTTLKNRIQAIQELLKLKHSQTHIQTEAYKKLTHYYKQMSMERRNFIHPMAHQDILTHLERLTQINQNLNAQLYSLRQIREQYQEKEDQLMREQLLLKHNINHLAQTNKQLIQSNTNLSTQNHKIMLKLKEELHKLHQIQNKHKHQISIIKHEHQQCSRQLTASYKLVAELKTEIQSQRSLLKSNEQHFHHKYQSLEKELQETKKLHSHNLNREIHHKPQKQSFSKSIQTQLFQFHPANSPQQLISQPNLKHRQIPPIHNHTPISQSKQIVQDLLKQTQHQDHKHHSVLIQENIDFQNQNQKQIEQKPKDVIKNPSLDKKKVEKKDFKRALRLTFMRR